MTAKISGTPVAMEIVKAIVEECMVLCEQQADTRQTDADFNYRIGCYDCQKAIKQHFGVN